MMIKKISYMILTIFLAILFIFLVVRMAPGDPVERILGPNASLEEVTKYRSQLNLDAPVLTQLKDYYFNILRGDLGKSLFKKKEVITLLKEHFPPTMIIALFSISLSTIIGVFWGLYSGFKHQKVFDGVSRFVSLIFLSCPIFSLAPLLVYFFSIKLGVFPVSEWESGWHAFLPILTLVLPLSSILTRVMRNKYLEECKAPWVQVLSAKGLSQFSIQMRLVKICLPTLFNVVAIQLSVVLAGTMITETIFDIPGMGMLLFEGIQNRDYPIVQGVIIYSTIIYMLIYFFVDLINERIDPRIQ
jgi:peptide/nickel transport system permease protein